MKVIITGCTGLVGSALVRQCIASDDISHVFAITRRPLDEAVAKNPKVTVIHHHDFSTYPTQLLDKVRGAEGCLWAIGGRATQFLDVETYRKVQVDYPVAAANAFRETLTPLLAAGSQFRFVFCSGKFAEWDQSKRLHFMADTRHVKGLVEQQLCQIADADPAKRFMVYCARPSGILRPDTGLAARFLGKLYGAIDVDQLAKALIKVLLEGYQDQVIENRTLLAL